jgi:predicted transcriptional regulator of viral defense system
VNPSPKKFFGFERVDVLGYKVMISDREKTAIDCVDRPSLAGGVGEAASILGNATRRFDWRKAVDYLQKIGSGALVRRFGWLSDHVKAEIPQSIREELLGLIGNSTKAWLGAAAGREVRNAIGYNETWRLFVNVPQEELHGSTNIGHRKPLKKGSREC